MAKKPAPDSEFGALPAPAKKAPAKKMAPKKKVQ